MHRKWRWTEPPQTVIQMETVKQYATRQCRFRTTARWRHRKKWHPNTPASGGETEPPQQVIQMETSRIHNPMIVFQERWRHSEMDIQTPTWEPPQTGGRQSNPTHNDEVNGGNTISTRSIQT